MFRHLQHDGRHQVEAVGREPVGREVRRGRLGGFAGAVHGPHGQGQEAQRPRQHLRQPQGGRRRRGHAHVSCLRQIVISIDSNYFKIHLFLF